MVQHRSTLNLTNQTTFENRPTSPTTRDRDYSIGSWPDDHHHESYAVETAYRDQGAGELHEGFTYEELLNMQRRDETDSKRRKCAIHALSSRAFFSTQSAGVKAAEEADSRPITLGLKGNSLGLRAYWQRYRHQSILIKGPKVRLVPFKG